jgi:P27 family predicted phage terminase small subunit
MTALGIAEAADEDILSLAATRHEDMATAREAIQREGSTTMDEHGNVKRNPNWITYEKATTHLKSLLGDLGLTPSARAKLGGPTAEVDPFAELANKAKDRKIAQFKTA